MRFAAVDLGAESGRVALGRLDGSRLSLEIVHRFANVPVRDGGRLRWDVRRLYAETLAGLRAAASKGGAIDSVGVDAWAVDFGMIGSDGSLLANPVHYRDARRQAGVERVFARIPRRELYERTGIQHLPINTIFELAAMAADSDPTLEAADKLLLIPDLMHYWLAGTQVSEFTNATTTQCFDAREGRWSFDLLAQLGISAQLLPDVVSPASRLGPMTDDESGLAGASVVAGATHDTAAAVAGTALGARSAFLSVGTWSLVGIESQQPVITDAAYRANITNEGGVAGTFRVLRNLTGLWLLEECRRSWRAVLGDRPLEELLELAVTAPALRSLVDPNDPLFMAPGDMPARLNEYCARTGQPSPEGVAATVRCILESLALKHAETVELIAEVTGREIDELHMVGGGANNALLCQWTAAAAERPVHAGPAEATAVGNVLVQAIAAGELSSLDEAREVIRRSFPIAVYPPKASAAWQEARERFATLSRAEALA